MKNISKFFALLTCIPTINFASESAINKSYFFINVATHALINKQELTLNQLAPSTINFTDTPVREGSHMSTSTYMSLWAKPSGYFYIHHPIATLTGHQENIKKPLYIRMSLTNATFHPKLNQLTYEISSPKITQENKSIDKKIALDNISLTIDSMITDANFKLQNTEKNIDH